MVNCFAAFLRSLNPIKTTFFQKTGLSCDSCDCEIKGTVSQLQNCEDMSGICFCKDNVIGEKCAVCRDETFNITIDNDYGCSGELSCLGEGRGGVVRMFDVTLLGCFLLSISNYEIQDPDLCNV